MNTDGEIHGFPLSARAENTHKGSGDIDNNNNKSS